MVFLPSLKLTANLHLWGSHPTRKRPRLPTIHFQVQLVSFRECSVVPSKRWTNNFKTYQFGQATSFRPFLLIVVPRLCFPTYDLTSLDSSIDFGIANFFGVDEKWLLWREIRFFEGAFNTFVPGRQVKLVTKQKTTAVFWCVLDDGKIKSRRSWKNAEKMGPRAPPLFEWPKINGQLGNFIPISGVQ